VWSCTFVLAHVFFGSCSIKHKDTFTCTIYLLIRLSLQIMLMLNLVAGIVTSPRFPNFSTKWKRVIRFSFRLFYSREDKTNKYWIGRGWVVSRVGLEAVEKRKISVLLYAFFWVIPRRLNCICRRFGTRCSIFIGR